jgi:hypothetical protein
MNTIEVSKALLLQDIRPEDAFLLLLVLQQAERDYTKLALVTLIP